MTNTMTVKVYAVGARIEPNIIGRGRKAHYDIAGALQGRGRVTRAAGWEVRSEDARGFGRIEYFATETEARAFAATLEA